MNTITLEQVEGLAAQLLPQEQLQLLASISERLSHLLIVHDLSSPSVGSEPHKRYEWMSIRGIAPNLLEGEDAQAWVSRTRSETDEHRERQWRREP
jgi:hypothetical protein